MSESNKLNVWYGEKLVGTLWHNQINQIGFRYSADWLDDPSSFGISNTLPLSGTEFLPQDLIAHRFFTNLLPEGGARDHIVQDLKIANTDFDLLRAIGGECAGALSLLATDKLPVKSFDYQPISNEGLSRMIVRKGRVYYRSVDERPRLSLAGAQDKCAVLYKDQKYWLPKSESPTTHILKFEVMNYRNLPVYETFTTMLARSVNLPVVDLQLHFIANNYFIQIKRYDRNIDDNNQIIRLHQEDFCQALGFGYEKKYQSDGGPSFADCYNLLRDVSSEPANDLQHLLNWQIFNVLAGNSDGHSKNLSLLFGQDQRIRLAPFYDLICTNAIQGLDNRLAMSVGEQKNPNLITTDDWKKLAQECGIRPNFLLDKVKRMADDLIQNLKPITKQFEEKYGRIAALERIERVVIKRCRRADKTVFK